jgi:hypothetical protein
VCFLNRLCPLSLSEISNRCWKSRIFFCVGNLRLTNSGSHRCRREDVGSRFSNQVAQSAMRSRRLMTRINASLAIDLEQATEPHSLASAFEIQNDQSTVTPEFASGSKPRHRFLRDINQARSLSVLQHARLRKSLRAKHQRCKTSAKRAIGWFSQRVRSHSKGVLTGAVKGNDRLCERQQHNINIRSSRAVASMAMGNSPEATG